MQETSAHRFLVRARELAGAIAVLALGCDGIASVEVERRSGALLPADEQPGEIDFGEFDNDEDISKDDIASAHITSVLLDVVGDGDLAFIDSVEIYVDAPGLPRRLLASHDEFPTGESRIALRPEGFDLEPYVIAETLHFTAIVDGEPPDEDTLVEATALLDVNVTAEGVCNAM
jgi:hypothetical protein